MLPVPKLSKEEHLALEQLADLHTKDWTPFYSTFLALEQQLAYLLLKAR